MPEHFPPIIPLHEPPMHFPPSHIPLPQHRLQASIMRAESPTRPYTIREAVPIMVGSLKSIETRFHEGSIAIKPQLMPPMKRRTPAILWPTHIPLCIKDIFHYFVMWAVYQRGQVGNIGIPMRREGSQKCDHNAQKTGQSRILLLSITPDFQLRNFARKRPTEQCILLIRSIRYTPIAIKTTGQTMSQRIRTRPVLLRRKTAPMKIKI